MQRLGEMPPVEKADQALDMFVEQQQIAEQLLLGLDVVRRLQIEPSRFALRPHATSSRPGATAAMRPCARPK